MPALALADAARDRWPELTVSFIGAERGLEARLLPERGEKALLLAMHGVKGAGLLQRLRVLLWELPRAVIEIRRSWREQRPDLLVGVGGYASISGVVAALLSRIPVVLYEQNAMPGLVNRTLARFCQRMMLGFAEAADHLGSGVVYSVTGNIVRDEISSVQWQQHSPPKLLVMGGSQGALILNQTVPEVCALLVREGREFTVTHVAGKDKATAQAVRAVYEKAGVQAEVIGFCEDMPAFYASGDLMIARAGAMSVTEAAVSGIPSLYVPLPHAADDHQYINAKSVADAGGAKVLIQHGLTTDLLANEIGSMLFQVEKLTEMSKAAKAWAPDDARARQLDVLAEYIPAAVQQMEGEV